MKVKNFIKTNAVPLMFLLICIVGVYFSGTNIATIFADLVNRFDRNVILILSLIIPVICGLGMNFAMVLGAMAGQLGLVAAYIWNVDALPGIIVASLVAIPLGVFLGYLAGQLLNRTKGNEMITGMVVGYFANGVYQFIMLFILGGIIKIQTDILLPGGVGIKNTIDLSTRGMKYALGGMKLFGLDTRVNMFTALIFFGIQFLVWFGGKYLIKKKLNKSEIITVFVSVAMIACGLILPKFKYFMMWKALVKVPIPTFELIILACMATNAFLRTKLGQDMRAVGNDAAVASSAGINVDKTRVIAMMISTAVAAFGMVLYYQSLGVCDTYYGHEQVGTYCVAAILIGGASIKKATVKQALIGTLLFHLLFNVSPLASQHIFSNSVVGGYFRMALCYGVIAFSLILHKQNSRKSIKKIQEGVK